MTPAVPSGLSRRPVVLTGRWTTQERAVWSATAACEQPIVRVSILVCDGTAQWSKSVRLAPEAEAVRIALGVDPADRSHVIIACGPASPPVRLAADDARPPLAETITIETGVVSTLCRFEASPTVEIAVLFLVTADVRFGRNRLWRLPPAGVTRVEEPLRAILAGGRAGACGWPRGGQAQPGSG